MKNLYFIFHTVIIFLGNLPSYEGFFIYFYIENFPNVFKLLAKWMEFTLETFFIVFWLFQSISQMVSQMFNVFLKMLIDKGLPKGSTYVFLFWVSAECLKKVGDGLIKLELRIMIIYQNWVFGFDNCDYISYWIFDLFENLWSYIKIGYLIFWKS